MSQEPLFWYRPRSDGGYEGPLHNGQIEDVRKASGAWVPLFAGAAPVSSEPVGEIVLFGGDNDLKEVSWRKGKMPPPGTELFAAPVAAQSDLTQQTLDDVMAGIPARDAEIEALRKQVETLQAQLVDISPEMQGTPVDESPNLQSQQQPVSGADASRGSGVTWADAQKLAGIPAVDSALEVFCNGGTAENALALVRAVMIAQQDADKADAGQHYNDGFSDGVILALQLMTMHGDYNGTQYCELFNAAGPNQIVERAIREGMWEMSGLSQTPAAVERRAAIEAARKENSNA